LTYEVVWADEAFAAAQTFMAEDPVGLASVFDTVDELAAIPRPPIAIPWGSTDFLRLRVGRYRVLYEIEERLIRINVVHLGRGL
jgi:mRNA interferase RelE/StbE